MAERNLPYALESMAEIREVIGGRKLAFFLDLDGTLAPIASRPELVEVPAKTRAVLVSLAELHLVCVASGRGLEDVRRRIGLESIYYVGDHGHRIMGPEGSGIYLEVGAEYQEELQAAARELERRLLGVDGAMVEAKGLSLSVHYRLVVEDKRPLVQRAVAEVAERFPTLRLTGGKMVYGMRPSGAWHKGRAILWLLERLDLGRADVCPVCLGDDLTDEDMFAAAAGWGVTVVVGYAERPTRAHYRVRDCDEATALLGAFAAGRDHA